MKLKQRLKVRASYAYHRTLSAAQYGTAYVCAWLTKTLIPRGDRHRAKYQADADALNSAGFSVGAGSWWKNVKAFWKNRFR